MTEREITLPVDLCAGEVVAPAAIGWSRRPLHRCRVDGPWGRRKRWHHWCVTSAREVVALTFADLDYLGLFVAFAIDRGSGEVVKDVTIRPLGWRALLPESAAHGRVEVAHGRTRVAMCDGGARVTLVASTPKLAVDVEVTRPDGVDTLGVAVAWPGSAGRRFVYTSKQSGLPARGTYWIDGDPRTIADGAVACLDWGRGVWPHRTAWNWASAADGRVALNLGAQWTDGGGATENAVIVDGSLRKLPGDVRFEWDRAEPRRPWRIVSTRGDAVDLTVTPELVERTRAPLAGDLCMVFGSFRGRAGDVELRDLFGWAEELHVRW
jgi:hypothetical protein